MEIIWLAVFAVLLVGYFALEGFDIGLGMMLPVLARAAEPGTRQSRRDRVVSAMAPFVLANEVWLVALAGTLFGVFPALEGKVLSGLYPVVVTLLASWILRDAGLWFRRRLDGATWRSFWDAVLCAGSWGLALSWGVALASVVRGLPAQPFDLPGLLYGAVVAAAFAYHGRAFQAWRLCEPGETGRRLLVSAAVAALPAAVPLVLLVPSLLDHTASPATLNVLSFIALPVTPILVGAQVWVWRTFGPVRPAGAAARIPSFF